MMKRLITLTLTLLLISVISASAQVATAANKIGFTTPGQDASVAVQALYKGYVDASTTGVTLTGLTCAGTASPGADCSVSFPSLTLGAHTITLSQSFGTSESSKSTPALSFTFVVVVTPTNLRIVSASGGDDDQGDHQGDHQGDQQIE